MDDKKAMMYHGKNWFMIFGILAVVYGLINWFVAMGWAPYTAWIVGGIILLLVGWIKKWMKMGMYSNWK